ncbi:unnamed protein product [Lampetra fluviatilis]
MPQAIAKSACMSLRSKTSHSQTPPPPGTSHVASVRRGGAGGAGGGVVVGGGGVGGGVVVGGGGVVGGAGGGSSPVARHRRTRCKRCPACRSADCGRCAFCRDMRKFGGPGRMKQSCLGRQCTCPMLPHVAVCAVCGRCDIGGGSGGGSGGGGSGRRILTNAAHPPLTNLVLMECSLCGEIAHPACLKVDVHGAVIHENLPNCWECPKCNKGAAPITTEGRRQRREGGARLTDMMAVVVVDQLRPAMIAGARTALARSRGRGDRDQPVTKKEEAVVDEEEEAVVVDEEEEVDGEEGERALQKEVWVNVFPFLSCAELCTCMRVCKAWNRW